MEPDPNTLMICLHFNYAGIVKVAKLKWYNPLLLWTQLYSKSAYTGIAYPDSGTKINYTGIRYLRV